MRPDAGTNGTDRAAATTVVPILLHVGLALALAVLGFLSPLIYGGALGGCFGPRCDLVDARVIPAARVTWVVLPVVFLASIVITARLRDATFRWVVPFAAGGFAVAVVVALYLWVWAPN